MSCKSSSGSCSSSTELCVIHSSRPRTCIIQDQTKIDCGTPRKECTSHRMECTNPRIDSVKTKMDCAGYKMDCSNTRLDCGGDNAVALLLDKMDDSQMTDPSLNVTDSNTSTLIPDPYPLDVSCREVSPSMMSLGYYDDVWNGSYEVLYAWIDRMEIVKMQKNVNRDFSDGVLMAELLKKLYPKMVDLHNYSPANSFNNKLANWTTLNNKVLRKLRLGQSQKTLQDLAKAEPGVLETLLSKIKQKYENSKMKPVSLETVNSEDLSTNVIVLNGQKISKDQYKTMVSKCDQLQDQLTESDEVIKILKNKVSHLEELLEIKDEIIRNLRTELGNFKSVTTTDILASVSELANMCRSPVDRNMAPSPSMSTVDSMNSC